MSIDYGALILNVAGLDPGWNQDGLKLPARRCPTYLHLNRESAEKELLRLQGAHPDSEFVLLEMTARGEVVEEQPDGALDEWKQKHGLWWGRKIAKLVRIEGGQDE